MISFTKASLVTGIASFLLQSTFAAPTRESGLPTTLFRRSNTFEDCNDDQRTKAGQALADAATLARWVGEYPDDYKGSDAFKHYFITDGDLQIAKSLFSTVEGNNAPDHGDGSGWSFVVTCKDDPVCHGQNRDGDSFAVTDVLPASGGFVPHMRLCPRFFDKNDPQTKNDLNSKEIIKNPGRRDNSWCQPGAKFRDLVTAGTTILHEMTHLDTVGKLAGVPESYIDPNDHDKGTTHGTEDVEQVPDPNYTYDKQYAHVNAQKLRDDWASAKDGRPQPKTEVVQNAESFAASATEWYFQQRCGFSTIPKE